MIEINKQDYELAISEANHSQLLTMFEKLKEENLALKAQVEKLREAVMGVRDSSHTNGFGYPDISQLKAQREAWRELNDALATTPAQCLAEIKAQAVESIDPVEFIAMAMRHCQIKGDFSYSDVTDAFKFIANQLRQQAKAGE